MTVTLTRNLYRRPKATNEVEAIGFLATGSVIEIAEKVQGKPVDGIATWYKATDGFYYWGGGVQDLSTVSIKVDHRQQISGIPAEWLTTNGRNVKIAILDTGFFLDHPDLAHLKGKCVISDFGGNNNTDDKAGHGTHVLGLLGAKAAQADGVTGLINEAHFFLYKVILDDVGFLDFFVEAAIEEAIKMEVDIINMSFNVPSKEDSSLHKTIKKAFEKNILLISSAGENANLIQSALVYPSQFDEVISVGEADKEFAQSLSVNLNEKLDFILPFVAQNSCWINDASGLYKKLRGSSMASALVSGVFAACLSNKGSRSGLPVDVKKIAPPFSNSVFNDGKLKIVIP